MYIAWWGWSCRPWKHRLPTYRLRSSVRMLLCSNSLGIGEQHAPEQGFGLWAVRQLPLEGRLRYAAFQLCRPCYMSHVHKAHGQRRRAGCTLGVALTHGWWSPHTQQARPRPCALPSLLHAVLAHATYLQVQQHFGRVLLLLPLVDRQLQQRATISAKHNRPAWAPTVAFPCREMPFAERAGMPDRQSVYRWNHPVHTLFALVEGRYIPLPRPSRLLLRYACRCV